MCVEVWRVLQLPRGAEAHIRPAFLCQLQVDTAGGHINQITAAVFGEVVVEFALEFFKLFGIVTTDPAGCRYAHVVVDAFDVVFRFEAEGGDIELEDADGAQNQVVVLEGADRAIASSHGLLDSKDFLAVLIVPSGQ